MDDVTSAILSDESALALHPPNLAEFSTLVAAGTRAIAARFAK